MNHYPPPRLPFPSYKWRWASVTPSEGLNNRDVFLGVLRALARHEGARKGNAALLADLAVVQAETGTRVDLARTGTRNLLRNSGQYWHALRLIDNEASTVQLTPFGREVASGQITPDEFAATVVRTHRLPNPWIEDAAPWRRAGLEIKPLALLLELMARLGDHDRSEAYLTADELVRAVIPLAGAGTPIDGYLAPVLGLRRGLTTLPGWPDCAPAANDKRMAREFLLFLANNGFGVASGHGSSLRVNLAMPSDEVADLLAGAGATLGSADVAIVRQRGSADLVQRARRTATTIARPGQRQFRADVLAAYGGRCLLSGETYPPALEAAHIRGVEHEGPDHISNGILLRADLHLLFDGAHIKISDSGVVLRQGGLATATTSLYSTLPPSIAWPSFVDLAFVRWRNQYQ